MHRNAIRVFDALGSWWHDPQYLKPATCGGTFRRWPAIIDAALTVLRQVWSDERDQPGRIFPARKFSLKTDIEFAHPLRVARDITEHELCLDKSAGLAHGDLHSRNVLHRGYDDWVVIDFEDVSADTLIGLDFAAIECDLKFRCLREIPERMARFCVDLKLARSFADHEGQASAQKLLDLAKDEARETNISELAFVRVLQIRDAAWPAVWRNDTDAVKRFQMHVAILLRSLEMLCYAEDRLDREHIWFGACLAADVVRRMWVVRT